MFFASHERKDTLCLFLTHFLCLIVRPILHFSLIVTQTEVVDLSHNIICAHIDCIARDKEGWIKRNGPMMQSPVST